MHAFKALLLFLLPVMANAADFQAGQVWSYKTRAGEADSTLTILRVEQYKDLGRVVHVRVDQIHMLNPVKGNVVTDIPHMPFKEAAVRRSVVKQVSQLGAVPEFQDGYDVWKKAYVAGQAGAFYMPVKDVLDAMPGAKWEEKK